MSKSPMEVRLHEAWEQRKHLKYPPATLDEIAEDEFKGGARFVLELPEVKALEDALVTIDSQPGIVPRVELERAIFTARDALKSWRDFKGVN